MLTFPLTWISLPLCLLFGSLPSAQLVKLVGHTFSVVGDARPREQRRSMMIYKNRTVTDAQIRNPDHAFNLTVLVFRWEHIQYEKPLFVDHHRPTLFSWSGIANDRKSKSRVTDELCGRARRLEYGPVHVSEEVNTLYQRASEFQKLTPRPHRHITLQDSFHTVLPCVMWILIAPSLH